MSDTINRFADGLKKKLRENKDVWHVYDRDTSGGYHYLDWAALNAEIDEFIAEFNAEPPK